MNLLKENRHLLRSKPDPNATSSKPKTYTPSTEKENHILDYIYKEKIRTKIKNQTANLAGRLKREVDLSDSSDMALKKKCFIK